MYFQRLAYGRPIKKIEIDQDLLGSRLLPENITGLSGRTSGSCEGKIVLKARKANREIQLILPTIHPGISIEAPLPLWNGIPGRCDFFHKGNIIEACFGDPEAVHWNICRSNHFYINEKLILGQQIKQLTLIAAMKDTRITESVCCYQQICKIIQCIRDETDLRIPIILLGLSWTVDLRDKSCYNLNGVEQAIAG